MASPILTHDLFGHAIVQGAVIGTAAVVPPPSLWAPLLASVVGAVTMWALQELSKGLWRQITVLETRVAELEALRCPYGQAARDQCAARPAPSPPLERLPDGRPIE
jgi:hypothetical protein